MVLNKHYQKSVKQLTPGKVSEGYSLLIFLNCIGALNKLLKQEKGEVVKGKAKGSQGGKSKKKSKKRKLQYVGKIFYKSILV